MAPSNRLALRDYLPAKGTETQAAAGCLAAADVWSDRPVLITGFGVTGFPLADQLAQRGARVMVLEGREANEELTHMAEILDQYGVQVRFGAAADDLPEDFTPELVVTSPGWRPEKGVFIAAAEQGIPVWGEVELAWHMRPENSPPWLVITGTNGKTTTVQMLESILRAAGQRAIACGNVGMPLLECVLHPDAPFDVLAVELSTFQLHWQNSSMQPLASALLNIDADHIDWHGSFEEYARVKGLIYENSQVACIYNVQDELTRTLLEDADVIEGCRAVGFSIATPGLSMLGVVEDVLVDRAFISDRRSAAAEIASFDDFTFSSSNPPAPHLVANALAAAGLARAFGVEPWAIRDGLRGFVPDAHRVQLVSRADGITWVDDSKATNPHAAKASLQAFPTVVWVAGGLPKGADFDDLVKANSTSLKAVILIGRETDGLRASIERHAPNVRLHRVEPGETVGVDPADGMRVMREVVAAAQWLAVSGDTVLLAPACASMDQFVSYKERGDFFQAAVKAATGAPTEDG